MVIICAWCEQEGTTSLLAVQPPWNDDRVSHGICGVHAATYRETFRSQTQSGDSAPQTTPRPFGRDS